MVTLMLHNPCMKVFHGSINQMALAIVALVANMGVAGYFSAYAWNRKAALPILLFLFTQNRDNRINQDGFRYGFGIGIAWVMLKSKGHKVSKLLDGVAEWTSAGMPIEAKEVQ